MNLWLNKSLPVSGERCGKLGEPTTRNHPSLTLRGYLFGTSLVHRLINTFCHLKYQTLSCTSQNLNSSNRLFFQFLQGGWNVMKICAMVLHALCNSCHWGGGGGGEPIAIPTVLDCMSNACSEFVIGVWWVVAIFEWVYALFLQNCSEWTSQGFFWKGKKCPFCMRLHSVTP